MEKAVEVRNLSKTFTFPVKDPARGFFANLFSPLTRSVAAVDDVSFSVAEGESLAFIGPNGAGKSTTIKMLTGILWPTGGSASVLGLDPQKDRRELALNIGTVFGQRSQLIFNLPARDSFDLFAKVYEVEKPRYLAQREKLIALFDLANIIDQPVRKLSLGQRMRAEIAVALLHEPPIVFLDEPSIGLDVVAKRRLRANLKAINKELKTTVFLTSHDAGDIESICERTIIVNHGKIVFDDKTVNLKRHYLNKKVVRILLEEKDALDITAMPKGIEILKNKGGAAKFTVDTSVIAIDEVLKEIIHGKNVQDINIEDPPLEEVIGKIYEHKTD